MSAPSGSGRTARVIKVDTLARVEGEGAIYVKIKGDRVQDIKLRIPEPPRLFEAFLRGRHFTEAPDITARICGICPVAYQMSAVHAIERALGVTVDPAVRMLRRLFYCGEWIESHALHIFLLQAPDLLGYDDAIQMAREHKDAVELALRLKKTGNHLMTVLGGREIHPVSACVGGFWKVPTKDELLALRPELVWALEAAERAAKLVATFSLPDFEQNYEYVSLRNRGEYPLNEGRIVSSQGLDIDAAEYEDHFLEQHLKHSNALHSALRERGSYLVGPLARFHLNFEELPEVARRLSSEIGLEPPCRNPFRGILVRAVELFYACHEALRIVDAYEPPAEPRVPAPPRASTGHAATEAPRGLLYHRYVLDEKGLILSCRIVPPTSQNLKRIEDDLWHFVPTALNLSEEELTLRCEQVVRNYDPCISCATHFLKLRVERES